MNYWLYIKQFLCFSQFYWYNFFGPLFPNYPLYYYKYEDDCFLCIFLRYFFLQTIIILFLSRHRSHFKWLCTSPLFKRMLELVIPISLFKINILSFSPLCIYSFIREQKLIAKSRFTAQKKRATTKKIVATKTCHSEPAKMPNQIFNSAKKKERVMKK